MLIERLFPSGAIRISGIHDGYLVSRIFYGYSQNEAIERFNAEFPDDDVSTD